MSSEQSKAAARRFNDGNFHNRYYVGRGVDIGGGKDSLRNYIEVFPLMTHVDIWDVQQGDARLMEGVKDDSYDFVHSSHCLEHLTDVYEGLSNWIRIIKPGGYLIVAVPDENLYERMIWPSKYNLDHKVSFTIHKSKKELPNSINILDLCVQYSDLIDVERVNLINNFFLKSDEDRAFGQTGSPNCECAIEFIWRIK